MNKDDYINLLKTSKSNDEVEFYNKIKDKLSDEEIAEVLDLNLINIDELLGIEYETTIPTRKSTKRYTVNYNEDLKKYEDDYEGALKLLQITDVINKYSEEEIIVIFERITRQLDDKEKIEKIVPYMQNDKYSIVKYYIGNYTIYTAKKK